MSKIKDFMRALLYEDVDVDDKDELEEEETRIETAMPDPVKITFPDEEPAPAPAAVEQPVVSAPVEEVVVEQIEETVPVEAAPAEPEKTTSIFDGLDAADVSRPAPEKAQPRAKAKTSKPYRYDRSKHDRAGRYTPRSEAGYQAVISPIFGNVADSKKQYDRIHDAINLPKPDKSFEMTKIISPMYGNDKPIATPVEEIPAYTPKGSRRKAAPSRDEALKPVSDVQSMMEKEPVKETAEQSAAPVQGSLLEKGEQK